MDKVLGYFVFENVGDGCLVSKFANWNGHSPSTECAKIKKGSVFPGFEGEYYSTWIEDKRFCHNGCKNEFNNCLQREERIETNPIDQILKHNRRILKACLGKERSRRIAKEELLASGFRFDYYTHHQTNGWKQQYTFCYDFGYFEEGGDCRVVKGWPGKS